ncbi:CPBP family intramembrane glutamic endopeptidase [Flavobacterium sp. MK4S-17]|uniref:CPBP family intramembrane glutamic endopeptidase n=1 Tax=Flavobacterium sp. MK4S-17 TaxID=2543737 RepID=UPI001359C8C0|nr:CPBP family intramembrane glutamic endopeptidase [Flavobacterium sp. MK4S-17]
MRELIKDKGGIAFKAILLVVLLIVLEFSYALLFHYLFPKTDMKDSVQIGIDLSLLFTFLIGAKIVLKSNGLVLKKSFSGFKLFTLFIAIAFIWVVVSPLFQYPFFFGLPDSRISFTKLNILDFNSFFSYYSLLRVLLITPVLEELLFRKLIFAKLKSTYKLYPSIVLTSLLFSISHLDINNLLIFFIGSILLCLIYFKTNDVRYSIALHIAMNLFTLVLN